MNKEFFSALDQLEKEKGIPKAYMLERVSSALVTAHKREYGLSDNVFVETDDKKKTIKMFVKKAVVADVMFPDEEMSIDEARDISATASIGDFLNIELETRDFGRIAAQTAKQVIVQGIREAERGMVLNEFLARENEILAGVVYKIDPRNGNIIIKLTSEGEKVEAILGQNEQVRSETFEVGDHIKVYVVEVKKGPRGPQVLISRSHPGLVRRMFELEVPEISEGLVIINNVVRESGTRTKMAVSSSSEKIDAIGACIGSDRIRRDIVVKELRGEPVDIIRYFDDTENFVRSALAPAKVIESKMIEDNMVCRVVVPDDQLSLAIGKAGHNVRLAAKLTGVKIDIKAQSVGINS